MTKAPAPNSTNAGISGSRPKAEATSLLRIAAPLVAAYLAELAMFLTTKIVVGRLGYVELAAVGIAGHITFEVLIIAMGLVSAVGVLVAQAEGAGQARRAGHAARQGLIIAIVITIPATALVWHLDSILALTRQDPRVIALAQPYLHALSGSILPALGFAVLRSFVTALARTSMIMVITVAAVGVNYLLTLGLVYGHFGLPALGIAGAGWATTIVSWLMLLALGVYAYVTADFRGYGLFHGSLKIDVAVCRELVVLGVPIAGLVLLESGLFAAVSILSGILGAKTLAAYEIIIAWVSIPFVVALGIAEGTMVRVAYGMGRANLPAARLAGMTGITLGVLIVTLLVVIPLVIPQYIVSVFLDETDPGFHEILVMTTPLFTIVAVFQLFDGLQAITSRALRAMKDTIVPLWYAGFGYWVLGVGGGYLLAFPYGYAATGLWWGMALGLVVTASLLTWRFFKITARSSA